MLLIERVALKHKRYIWTGNKSLAEPRNDDVVYADFGPGDEPCE